MVFHPTGITFSLLQKGLISARPLIFKKISFSVSKNINDSCRTMSNQVEFLGLECKYMLMGIERKLSVLLDISGSIRTLQYLQKEACKTKIVPVLCFENAVMLFN